MICVSLYTYRPCALEGDNGPPPLETRLIIISSGMTGCMCKCQGIVLLDDSLKGLTQVHNLPKD